MVKLWLLYSFLHCCSVMFSFNSRVVLEGIDSLLNQRFIQLDPCGQILDNLLLFKLKKMMEISISDMECCQSFNESINSNLSLTKYLPSTNERYTLILIVPVKNCCGKRQMSCSNSRNSQNV